MIDQNKTIKQGKEGGGNIAKAWRKTNKKTMIEKYAREIKEHKISKFKNGIKYFGLPLSRAEEVMEGMVIGKPGERYPLVEDDWMIQSRAGLEVKREGVAKWAGDQNEGIFIKEGYGVKAWNIVGAYGGIITSGEGPYVLEMDNNRGGTFRVDAQTKDGISLFGKINEDIHEGEINVNFEDMGLIITTKDMEGPCELLTNYGREYQWDHIKWGSFQALKMIMNDNEGWTKNAIKCSNMEQARHGNKLEKLMALVVDGKMDTRDLHSTISDDSRDVTGFLTSGITYEKYRFGKWGACQREYEMKDLNRGLKRSSGLLEYTRGWNGSTITKCTWEELKRMNPRISDLAREINKVRDRHIGKCEEVTQEVLAVAQERESGGLEGGGRKVEVNGMNNKCDVDVEDLVEIMDGRRTERERPSENDQAAMGRVKTTLFLGTGGRRRENLRIINGCRSAEELKEKMRLLRIWRVEVSHDSEEDKVRGDGYCGYTAMAQIINEDIRRYDLSLRIDRITVAMATRNVIDNAAGRVREGFSRFNVQELNSKERAEMAYKKLMAQESHFMAYKGLESEYWMRGMLVDGRCDELRFSSWVKSLWNTELYYLQESQFNKRGDKLTIGEWRRVLGEKMLMCRDRHYHVRKGGLMEDFEHTVEVLITGLCRRLNLGQADNTVEDDEVVLVDKTPRGNMDSLLVAEAIISDRSPMTLLDINQHGTMNKLRKTRCEVEGIEEETDECLGDINLRGRGIGFRDIKELCTKHEVGMVVIKDGVMERVCTKTTKSDVILDEDIDHFYISGVGTEDKKKDVHTNKVAFWNCNGWGGDSHGDKDATLGMMAANEEVDMICVTDTRLDLYMGEHVLEKTCRELQKHTGKTWTGKSIGRREDRRSGGALILHTKVWTGVKMRDKIKYGVCVEVMGKWNGIRHTVISVYRPCYNDNEGSLRTTLEIEMRGKMEEELWKHIGDKGNEDIRIVGGDFNMKGDQVDRELAKIGGSVNRIKMAEGEHTFRKLDRTKERLIETTIDHVATSGGVSGCKTADGGLDMNDHAILIGWVEVQVDTTRAKEMITPIIATIRPTDKGATRKLEKIFTKTTDKELMKMDMEGLIKETMRHVKIITNNRNNKGNRNGWSPVTRIISMRISVHGTAIKTRGRVDHERILKGRVEELKRRERKMVLSEEEIGWMRDQGIRHDPADWHEWKMMYRDEYTNAEQMNRLKKLNSGRRRKELRILCNNRMYRIQADADAGRIGGVMRIIMSKRKGYKMECLVDGDECLTDPLAIDKRAAEHFKEWFSRTGKEREEGEEMDRLIRNDLYEEFKLKAKNWKIKDEAVEILWEGMKKKNITEEGKKESRLLCDYVPSFEEFEEMIKKMNPHSTGGVSGLTYFMVQKWETRVKRKVYDELRECWLEKRIPKGWGDTMLAPIPKVSDPTLTELRPLMLYEVLRKIWTGLIMEKLRSFWKKWDMIDENQHGFMGGKGTHTAIPIIINCMETARDFATDLYLSSWDIKRAFDSLGPEYVIRALERMHVPREMAEYLVKLDSSGKTYVRTPTNIRLNNEGRLGEGEGFRREKGVGQGDVPSPMLWVAAFDPLLTALGRIESGFKTQDTNGTTRMVKDVAFADDLISVTGTIGDLQRKADVMTAWCLATGVEIAAKKLRTFGREWGVEGRGEDKVIEITNKSGERQKIEVKGDGIMTHLGVIWNMDMSGEEQWNSINETINRIGEEVIRGRGRMRDKAMVINYCLKATVLYRMQYCTWDLKKYKRLDKALNKLLRKVTKNMKNFPGELLHAEQTHGGLGLRSLSDEANERKLKLIMDGIHKDDQTAFAWSGIAGRGHRASGKGGLENTEQIIEPTIGDTIWITSLVQWLGEMRLDLKTCGARSPPKFAAKKNSTTREKIELNKRGIVLRGEGDEGRENEKIELRVGQCWMRGREIIEIVGFNGSRCEIIRWEGKSLQEGKRVKINRRRRYEGYPMGMGAKESMLRTDIARECKLVELGKDCVKGKEVTCEIIRVRNRMAETNTVVEKEEERWKIWRGKKFKNIYTDGSWKETKSVRSIMLGGSSVKAGGGVVLAGDNWYSPLFIEMDMEAEGAFTVETIALLAGCAIGEDDEVTINTDCKGAMAAEMKRNKDFNRILGGWRRGSRVSIKKVKAHPERRGGEWSKDDEGIYMADVVAGGSGGDMPTIRATEVVGMIARKGKLMVCGENGEPFIGSIRKRNSREKLNNYWKRRDKYREARGRIGIWEGTRIDMSHKMMGKGRNIENRSAVQRMAGGKRWCANWANKESCIACGDAVRSESHALRGCREESVIRMRKNWMDDVSKSVVKIKDMDLRGVLEETWTRMRFKEGGEMAMMGCFQPRWVDSIYKGRMQLRDGEDRTVNRILRKIGEGAAGLLRHYSQINKGHDIGVEYRQTNIRGFYGITGPGQDMPMGSVVRGGAKKNNKEKKVGKRGSEDKGEKMKGGYIVFAELGIIYWEFKKG